MQDGGNKMATGWRYSHSVPQRLHCCSSQLYSLSQPLPDGEGNPEQHLGAFEENRVPDLEHRGRRQAGGEDGEEPLHGEHVGERRLVATWSDTEASTHSDVWKCRRARGLYPRLPCWRISEGGGGAGRAWAASDAAGL